MKTLDEILGFWSVDAEMDKNQPGNELINIPKLHNKYLTILVKHKLQSKKINFEYLRMRKIKSEYYTGKLSRDELDEYNWEPFGLKPLKNEIPNYLESDTDLIKLLERKMYHDEIVSVVESIMNELKQRTWQLKEFINWEKFVSGS